MIETFYAVTTWGKQAKTTERKTRKPLIGKHYFFFIISFTTFVYKKKKIDEVRHERTFFSCISEHKDIVRSVKRFSGGFLLLKPYIDKLLNVSTFFLLFSINNFSKQLSVNVQ